MSISTALKTALHVGVAICVTCLILAIYIQSISRVC